MIVLTHVIPEIPDVEHGCVFWPGLPADVRQAYADAYEKIVGPFPRLGLSTPFDAEQRHGNWWWGMSVSAVSALLELAVGPIVEHAGNDLHHCFVARTVNGGRIAPPGLISTCGFEHTAVSSGPRGERSGNSP